MTRWTLDDIPWDRFEPEKISPDILAVVRAAAMVESNGADYAAYLCNVFHDDPAFQAAAREWAAEEVRHGLALGRWAEMADLSFRLEERFAKFRAGYRLPLEVSTSVRGSRCGELIARCVVETGTSSHYSALAEATAEPALQAICRKIAGDEFRHYKLFRTHLERYAARERLPLWRRVEVMLGRMRESHDDELAYAYHCGNGLPDPYDRAAANREYARRAYALYRPDHVRRGIGMALKTVGLPPQGRLGDGLAWAAWRLLRSRLSA